MSPMVKWLKSVWKEIAERSPAKDYSADVLQMAALAQKEASDLNHNFVATEHLLLGLMRLGEGLGFSILQKNGLNYQAARLEVEKQTGRGLHQESPPRIPYTPSSKRVLAFAKEEAKAIGLTQAGTGHVLLGLLRQGGVAGQILKRFGVDAEQVRQEILIAKKESSVLKDQSG